jgi:hypothetical protein
VVGLDRIVSVLAAVDLNDQPLLEADKVEIETEQRRLTAEVKSLLAQQTKLQPELSLLRCQTLSEFACAFGGGR